MVKTLFLILTALYIGGAYAQKKDTVYLIFDADARQRAVTEAILSPGTTKDTIAVRYEYRFTNTDPTVSRYDSATKKLIVKGRADRRTYGTIAFTNIEIRSEKAYDSLYNKQIRSMIRSLQHGVEKRDVYKLSASEVRDMTNYTAKLSSRIRKVGVETISYKRFLRTTNQIVPLSSIATLDELRKILATNTVYIVDVAEMRSEHLVVREVIRSDLLNMQRLQ